MNEGHYYHQWHGTGATQAHTGGWNSVFICLGCAETKTGNNFMTQKEAEHEAKTFNQIGMMEEKLWLQLSPQIL